ncbi:hypothetical protein RN001_014056 [Aquatica leii]|uniref:Gamma-tubulin complex component 6 n=1 Tax=Aquatica leii TaxID=1421715 RepID=A0AAN7S7C0_9COLE|nr:hypothetical protein RN001_014056 [Aquatica leii]
MDLDSVYELITKLCEKFSALRDNPSTFKEDVSRTRRKCFEILLTGKNLSDTYSELENNTDPVCHLLAWEYCLLSDYKLKEHSKKIRSCSEKLQSFDIFKDEVCSNIVMLLLNLKSVPGEEDSIMETTLNTDLTQGRFTNLRFPFFDESKFHISEEDAIIGLSKFESSLFKINNQKVVFRTLGIESSTEFLCSRNKMLQPKVEKKNCFVTDLPQNINIWEYAASKPLSSYRTWDEHGSSSPKKKIPFLSESSTDNTAFVVKLSTGVENCLVTKTNDHIINVISSERFVRDIKYLLVGIETKTFFYNDNGKFILRFGTYIETLTPGTIKSYCKDLIFCGQCYKGLDALCSQNSLTLKESNNGYIFFELCESIKRYLTCYRLAVLSIPNTMNLLSLHQHTKKLRNYIAVLASICKVGPYKESTQMPHGVALLNYLFQQVMSLTDTNVILALFSILYPCCQVYFSRFLQQWLLNGTICDPFGEFFINVHPKYITTRGRTYWTRSYTVRKDIVPDFIGNLSSDILACGKAMNLLKLCVPNSPLCLYIMEKHPDVITCCLTSEQLSIQEQNNYSYYLEATAVCGPRLSLSQIITSSKEEDTAQMNLIAKKRLATLNRIEQERKMESQREYDKRRYEMKLLQDQYLEALRLKRLKQAEELEDNLKIFQKNMWIQNLHNKIIAEESANLIKYYNTLYDACEERRLYFEKRSQNLRKLLLPHDQTKLIDLENTTEPKSVSEYSETQTSLHKEVVEAASDYVLALSTSDTSSTLSDTHEVTESASDINANSETPKSKQYFSTAAENFEVAKKNKAKVLELEMNIIPSAKPSQTVTLVDKSKLTEAQRNKLKVMSSEFDIDLTSITTETSLKVPLSAVEINRNKMMSSSDCFSGRSIDYINEETTRSTCDNENYLNKNVESSNFINKHTDKNENVIKKWVSTKQDRLSLDLTKIETRSDSTLLSAKSDVKSLRSPKFELNKVSPMSIDSTPLSSSVTTPLSKMLMFERNDIDMQSITETATTGDSAPEQAFQFEIDKSDNFLSFEYRKSLYNLKSKLDRQPSKKNVLSQDAKTVSTNCLKLYLQQSILLPLTAQTKLVTNELLKYFIKDQMYLKHLNSLRNYFFLLDGEFGRNITNNLFKKLYDVNFPMDLINIHTLTVLVYKAIDYSTKLQDHSQCLSFRVNDLPQVFDLGNPDVFDCISLTYKTSWPLNILIPSDSIAKYDEVFKFLLKLHRISWVLQKIFQDLKSLLKETELKKTVVMSSPQYRKLHQCRHVMTHFIQTLQTYIVSEVLHSSWEIFENHLKSVTTINQLYALHTTYIKNILFMCLLNQKSAPLQKVLNKIYIVILKFYDYLRSRSWYSIDGVFMHPNFKKLEDIFSNFQDLMLFLFKIGQKVVRCGYQPHLLQLLNMLNINDYYTKTR